MYCFAAARRFWYAFGDHGYNLGKAPDNVSMAATAIAI
jgi:hypothetical protein